MRQVSNVSLKLFNNWDAIGISVPYNTITIFCASRISGKLLNPYNLKMQILCYKNTFSAIQSSPIFRILSVVFKLLLRLMISRILEYQAEF